MSKESIRKLIEISVEELIEATKNVSNLNQLAKHLNLTKYKNFDILQRKIVVNNIDISHWDEAEWYELKKDWNWSALTLSKKERAEFIKSRGGRCESCSIFEWLGKPLTLEIHHIDGNRTNNNSSNLKLLCPNCHGLTENWKKRTDT